MTIARTWLLGGLGGAVATAAVIGGVWFATTSGDDDPGTSDPAATPSDSVAASPSPSEADPTPSASGSTGGGPTVSVPVYYAGEAPGGLALYREFVRVPQDDKVTSAVAAATVKRSDIDPDYTTLWPAGTTVTSAQVSDETGDGLITIDLAGDVHDRVDGMSEREAALAVEQLIYTAQGVVGMGRLPVQLLLDGKHTDTVLGVPTSEPLANGPVLETLSHVNITTPGEGDGVTADTLVVTGVANSFEANVVIRLLPVEGTEAVLQEPVTAEGWMAEKLFPFSGSFDISDVEPGRYVLSATTDDPSGGAEGNGPFTDTKVITIK